MFKRRLQKITSTIAIIAMVFASIAPTIAHALPVKISTKIGQEICTSQGVGKIPVIDIEIDNKSPDSAKNDMVMHFQHCLYCFADNGLASLLPDTLPVSFFALVSTSSVVDEYHSPIIFNDYQVSPPSQAPPSLN